MNGIRNADWVITLVGDGHQPATEPGNPDIIYSESQQGHLNRVDRTTGETVHIQPQPEPGDPPERFNWDAPILVSPHSPTRLYYASQRVWRSDDRGDSWRPVSGDLTRDEDRMRLPAHGAAVELGLAVGHEGHVQLQHHHLPRRVAAGRGAALRRHRRRADPGLRRTAARPGGRSRWARCPGCPPPPSSTTSRPTSTTRTPCTWPSTTTSTATSRRTCSRAPTAGATWSSIAGDLPDRHLVWRVVQDHVKPDLLFAATEFGIFFTVDGGARWVKLTGGVPTISFRDLAIQRRENDLVGASFGRGFFVLDDYTPLRDDRRGRAPGRGPALPGRGRPGGTSSAARWAEASGRRRARATSSPPTRPSARSSPTTWRRT